MPAEQRGQVIAVELGPTCERLGVKFLGPTRQSLPSRPALVRIDVVLFPRKRPNRGQVANDATGQSTKSLRSSPLRGGRSREAGSWPRGRQ